MSAQVCRLCGSRLERLFVDLGMSPLSNAYLREGQLEQMEPFFPLVTRVCDTCFLVQLGEFRSPDELFSDYTYFSSYSETWLRHAEAYANQMVERLDLGPEHLVVEIASNDGYLLRLFAKRGVRVLGVEPAANVAAVGKAAGVPTVVSFFGTETAGELTARGQQADLVVGNNVLAHVPDLNDFVAGMRRLLKPGGIVTLEFPHLVRLIEGNQFDTIYHEHFSYFSFYSAERALAAHELKVFDIEEVPTHGGSLRIYAQHTAAGDCATSVRVEQLRRDEASFGVDKPEPYERFADQVKQTKRELLRFLLQARGEGRTVVCYGAPAKGNTLLNYCGIRGDFIEYTVDRSPHKQGLFLPGTHLPIYEPARIRETRPDYVLILPWNLREEIADQMSYIREWNGRFVVAIPALEVLA